MFRGVDKLASGVGKLETKFRRSETKNILATKNISELMAVHGYLQIFNKVHQEYSEEQ